MVDIGIVTGIVNTSSARPLIKEDLEGKLKNQNSKPFVAKSAKSNKKNPFKTQIIK